MDMSNVLSAVISTGCKVSAAVLVVMVFLPISTVFSSGLGDCSRVEVKEFKKDGFSMTEIKELCKPSTTTSRQQTGQKCKTQNGECMLSHLPPAPIGTSCYCVNKYSGFNENGQVIY